MTKRTRLPAWILAAGLALGTLALPAVAHAWWRGGVFFGFPLVAPYYYVPPPVVYAPPPVVYSPPTYYGAPPAGAPQGAAAPACHAGAYVCPLEQPAGVGAPCSCPTNSGGRIAGQVG